MAEEENFENLDDLDWSDVESELKANREQIASEGEAGGDAPAASGGGGSASIAGPKMSGDVDIDFLLDVMLDISVEVGRTQMVIDDLLQLDQGSVVELKSSVGQPLDIRVNSKLVARGEIVVVNEKFAVRVTDVVSPDDRFAAL
ncbi:MAG: flagellar motor switch protein FliN [bacterium]|jgi:flagellar motor switch protein FliN/FliY